MKKNRKILIMGLPGSGKTYLAKLLAKEFGAVHFNADDIRQNINKDLGFEVKDRIEQARRMGWLCDRVNEAGHYAIADFVCPLEECRRAFGECFMIFMDTTDKSRFEDTNKIFERPKNFNFCVEGHNTLIIKDILEALGGVDN